MDDFYFADVKSLQDKQKPFRKNLTKCKLSQFMPWAIVKKKNSTADAFLQF